MTPKPPHHKESHPGLNGGFSIADGMKSPLVQLTLHTLYTLVPLGTTQPHASWVELHTPGREVSRTGILGEGLITPPLCFFCEEY